MATFGEGFNSVITNWVIDENDDQIDATDMYFYFPEGSSYLHGEYKKRGTILAVVDLNHDGVTNYRCILSNGNYVIFTVDNHNPTGTAWQGCDIDYTLYLADDTQVFHGSTSYSTANLSYGESAQWCDIYSYAGTGMITFADWYTESFVEGYEGKSNFNYGFAMINQYCGEGIDYPIGVPDINLESGVAPTFVDMHVDQCTLEEDVSDPSVEAEKWLQWLTGATEPKEDEPGEDTDAGVDNEPGGGTTSVSFVTDSITLPGLPSKGIANSGLCGIYVVTGTQMRQLSQFLWSANFFDNIIKNMASPLENIISFGVVPWSHFNTTSSTIGIGNIDTGITASKLTNTYYSLDCGTVNVKEIYGSYADYEPYSKIWLYLPYIGMVDLPTDDVARAGSINVVYYFDVFSGSCVAHINCFTNGAWNLLQEYEGNLFTSLPITGANYMQMYNQLAHSALGAAASIATENYGGLLMNAVQASTAKPQYARSGSVSNVAGLMSVQKPYIVKAIPVVVESKPAFKNTHGYVSNINVNVGSQKGYLRARVNNTMLTNIHGATNEELEEIKNLLAQGIFI